MSATRRFTRLLPHSALPIFCLFLAAVPTARAQVDEACCVAPDNGGGTALLPAPLGDGGCIYFGTTEIVDGLPVGTTIQIDASYGAFSNVVEVAGGSLGGTVSDFDAVFTMSMTGTGTLLGFNRFIAIPLNNGNNRISWSPRMPFAPVQNVLGDLERLSGQVLGDPDFDLLRITGGTNFGMSTPGQAQLVTSAGDWAVSSFFDVFHRIDFVGAPAGSLAGRSGSTTRQRRFTMCPGNVVAVETKTWSGIKSLLAN
ncbi:MAG: hypothetical protein FD129_645 [bacterium]|nr:MAG: hypothetical protein FD129_645 [bacterium]